MAGWANLLADTGDTRVQPTGTPYTIDAVLTNRGARAWVKFARLRWDVGLATHAAIEIAFDMAKWRPR
eukprot:4385502-Lingulodinium_polyedra.AAC.1